MADKLTDARLRAMPAPDTGRTTLTDQVVPGLLFTVTPTGHRSWSFRYRVRGAGRAAAPKRLTLGTFPAVPLATARDLARRCAAAVAAGGDPLAERQAEVEAARAAEEAAELERETEARAHAREDAGRLSVLMVAYFDHKRRTLKRAARTVEEQERLWRRDMAPVFGARRAEDITRKDVRGFMRTMADRPVLANRCLFLLTTAFNWMIDEEHIGETSANPCARIAKYPETPRERRITPTEWKRLRRAWQLVHARRVRLVANTPAAANATAVMNTVDFDVLHFLALTGWRKREAFALEWAHVDRLTRTATLPTTKTGRSTRALSPEALAVLVARPRLGPYVFPSPTNPARPLHDPRATWDDIRRVARVSDVTLHDLRRHVATIAAELGLPYEVRQALLGHRAEGMTAQYTIVSPEVLRGAAERVGAQLVHLATYGAHEPGARVLPITGARRAGRRT
jgi:integrase